MELSAFDLSGKVALITGGAHGIGFSIAEGMARCGATVCFNCSSQASYEKGMAAYQAAGIEAHGYVADVTDWDAVQAMVDKIAAEVGPVDILVNNAGITLPACPVEDITPERWRKVLDIDLMGTIYGTQCVIPVMKAHKSGKIINMASVAGQVGGVFTEATYPVSKAGVICWAKAVAKQVGEYNITCNCIAPGTILTAMTETLGSADASLNVPLHRLGSVKDVAGAALFLASDESDFITGATINVNGGMSMI